MTRTERMEWHQTPGNHVFGVFDTIPLIPLQSLPQARPPPLRCHQPPLTHRATEGREGPPLFSSYTR